MGGFLARSDRGTIHRVAHPIAIEPFRFCVCVSVWMVCPGFCFLDHGTVPCFRPSATLFALSFDPAFVWTVDQEIWLVDPATPSYLS